MVLLRYWRAKMDKQYEESQTQRKVSQLKVTKSKRQYNNNKRTILSIFWSRQEKLPCEDMKNLKQTSFSLYLTYTIHSPPRFSIGVGILANF